MDGQINNLFTASEVIDALGGTGAVSRTFDVKENVVSMWRVRGLPPDTFAAFTELLTAKGLSAPRSLWRQRELADTNDGG